MKPQTLTHATRRVIAAAVCAAALMPSFAGDWTVSANTTLTEDTTVDALTVNSDVTLDLNGYKLYCSSVAGSGTITTPATDADLTTSGGTCWASLSAAQASHGTVANLFSNNYTYKPDATHRFLLASDRLPVCIDYDFGAGNAQVVNAYKLWAGWKERAPKAWTLYGSNNDSAYQADSETDWVAIDSHSGETDWWQTNGNAKDYTADDNTYTCDNTTAYRYYRLKVTERVGSNGYFELVQLEYFNTTPGELHLNVASGTADWPSTITFSGNVKVVKDGTGTLAASGDLNLYDGTFAIKGGAVTVAGVMRIGYDTGKSAAVVIDDGSLTVNSGSDAALTIGDKGAGTLTINGGTVTVASKDAYFAYNSGASGTINLNGGTLVTRRVLKNNGSSRTLNFNGGTLKTTGPVLQNGLIASGITVNVGENGGTIDSGNSSDATSDSRVYVAAAIGGTGAMRFKGGKTINLEGAMNYTGGTTVELGTMLNVTDATAKTTVLGSLTVDGKTKTEDTPDIPVFQYTSDLTDPADLEHVSFLNCGEGTAAEISGAQILVDFVAPAWELDADHLTWSSLVTKYGAPASDARVIIKSNTAYTLTIDQDVTIGELVFTGSGSVTLAVESGKTLTTDDIAGVGGITNNGTIVKTGAGTVTWPFDNAATGTTIVNVGTLKVAGKVNEGTAYNVRVKGGATFDMNGVINTTVKVILEEGAFFVNTGGNIGYNNQQAVSITLEGNATATASGGDFGLIAPSYGATTLNLGSYTLTLNGSKTFRFTNTTITGDGTIALTGGCTVVIPNNTASGGADCTLTVGSGTTLNMGGNLSVKNFTNNGTIGTLGGTLTVTGTLTPGSDIRSLTLASGATIKATGTAQTVSTTFAASGTITVDASEIDAQTLKAAGETGIPVLTVPASFNTSSATWSVSGEPISGTSTKWRTDEGGTTKTLYIAQPIGLIVIFR